MGIRKSLWPLSLSSFTVLCTHTHTHNQQTEQIKHSNQQTISYRFLSCTGFLIFFFLSLFIWRERESIHVHGQTEEEQGERKRENPKHPLQCQHRAKCGTWSHDPEIMTFAEIKSQTLNGLSHLGSSVQFSLLTLRPFFLILFCCSFSPPYLCPNMREHVCVYMCTCVCLCMSMSESPGKFPPSLFCRCNYQLKITVIIVDENQVNIRDYLQQEKGGTLVFKLTFTT